MNSGLVFFGGRLDRHRHRMHDGRIPRRFPENELRSRKNDIWRRGRKIFRKQPKNAIICIRLPPVTLYMYTPSPRRVSNQHVGPGLCHATQQLSSSPLALGGYSSTLALPRIAVTLVVVAAPQARLPCAALNQRTQIKSHHIAVTTFSSIERGRDAGVVDVAPSWTDYISGACPALLDRSYGVSPPPACVLRCASPRATLQIRCKGEKERDSDAGERERGRERSGRQGERDSRGLGKPVAPRRHLSASLYTCLSLRKAPETSPHTYS